MDCEKFESTLMDELYGELDELTSAASKRHMAGCARCASLLGGLKATRRVAVLPILDTPPGLEEKILEAATEARKLVPFRGRMARAVSLAGSWAMKPQTAMAAVFLLMIGSGLAIFGGPKIMKSGAQASMTITQEGAPAALASASASPGQTEGDPMDLAAAANAHGLLAQDNRPPPPVAAATTVPPELQAVAQGDVPGSPNDALGQRASSKASAYGGGSGGGLDNGTIAAAASAAPMAPAATATAADTQSTASADFATATAAYRAKNYDEATRDFDALAAAGDDNAALWAARSVRDGNGCSTAVNRFDQLAGRAYGTPPGYDATFEAGQCYKSMGSFDAARQRFARLLTVPSHAARAQAELNKMAPTSTQHSSVKAPAARPIMPAPANAQQQNAF